jgi:hypothetical protein
MPATGLCRVDRRSRRLAQLTHKRRGDQRPLCSNHCAFEGAPSLYAWETPHDRIKPKINLSVPHKGIVRNTHTPIETAFGMNAVKGSPAYERKIALDTRAVVKTKDHT